MVIYYHGIPAKNTLKKVTHYLMSACILHCVKIKSSCIFNNSSAITFQCWQTVQPSEDNKHLLRTTLIP